MQKTGNRETPFHSLISFFYTLLLFVFGGTLYALIEILWRGHTHPSMVLLGGICFCCLAFLQRTKLLLLWKMLWGACLITALEYLFGAILNLWLSQNVWDYSHFPFSLHGQICLRYSFYWLLLTLPAFLLSGYFDRHILDRLLRKSTLRSQKKA